MRHLYSLVLYLLAPAVALRLLWLGLRVPDYLRRWPERFGFPETLPHNGPVIWLHAVSVGEVLAARPLLNRLLERYPAHRVVISTITPTGADMVRQSFEGSARHVYFPYDLPHAVHNYLERIRPALVVVMETEIWPNFYAACRRRGLPIVLVNARLSERSARGYRRVPGLIREALRCLSLVAAQSREDAARFVELGAAPETVSVCGNLKFDLRLGRSVSEQGQAIRRFLSVDRPVWIAASTHDGEEALVLDAFARVLERHPRCLLVLAPRHPPRFEQVIDLSRRKGFETVCRSRERDYHAQVRVFVLDSLGELPPWYAGADVAFVGGSLVPAGGHNLLEPACLGLPLLSGPWNFNFGEVSSMLTESGALRMVENTGELAEAVADLLADANRRHEAGERARTVFAANQGSADNVMQRLAPLLEP